ncbi:MAG: 2-phosphosulfolactate phosphatase [Gemmatimonadetes bacterium]|nr:2-phosphosulfolactate phosphatase [Gemmatimonadota bacterium]
MKLAVFFSPDEPASADLARRTVVIIDVLRATSTIVEALAHGARAILPAENIEEAVKVAKNVGRDAALLCGERGGLRIDGFDLGNSPAEYTPEAVGGKLLVMTTTNGTSALLATSHAKRSLVASFFNLEAVAADLASREEEDEVVVVCAGREGRFALEDAVCAGALALRLRNHLGRRLEPNDAASAALMLGARYSRSPARLLRRTEAGKQLASIGHAADVAFCAEVDRHKVVPELRERQITL